MRSKNKPAVEKESNGAAQEDRSKKEETVNGAAQGALERAIGTLYEATPEMEDNNEGMCLLIR
jgi:hypothetical protein